MYRSIRHAFLATLAMCLALAALPLRAEGPLVDVQWLAKNLGRENLLLLDASAPPKHAAKHIAGAVGVDMYGSGIHMIPRPAVEARLQGWGVSPGKKIVIYDQGGSMEATWLFYELYHHGFPEGDLHVLDGGLAKWEASGGAVTKEPTPAPAKGTFRITQTREDVRVRLPEFMVATGDTAGHAVVEALEPPYHFGDSKFFDRAGHIPNGIMWPHEDLFNPDKTFKSPEDIRRMAQYLGIHPEQQVSTYCGGGIAATVPFFALKFVSGYPRVKLYKESMLEWLRDDRGLPVWSFDAPYLRRDTTWVNGWNSRMMRMYGVARMSVVDVRPAESYGQGHVPFALNVPADVFRGHLDDPAKLAAILGPAGVSSADEAVIVSSGGVNEGSALAFLVLEKIGQKKVSILMESVDDWGLAGLPVTKEPTIVGRPKTPQDFAVPPATYAVNERPGVMVRNAPSAGPYPKVYLASGSKLPARAPDGKVVHVPYKELLNANGSPKAAAEIWKILVKAGVPRYAEIICIAEAPGEAAANYYLMKLMGYPDVKVLVL